MNTDDDALFRDVELGTYGPSACTPEQPGDVHWRGVVIRSPGQVTFTPGRPAASGRFAAIPVCGRYTIDMPKLANGLPITIFVSDARTGEVFTGPLLEVDDSPLAPSPNDEPIDPATLVDMAIGGQFNSDVTQYVKLPARAATYEVVIEYGGSRSNTVTISVVETR